MNFISLFSSSRGNAYLVTAEGASPLLLEAGVPIKRLRERLRDHGVMLTDLAGALISHEHQDHAKAVKDLLKAGVDCWMSPGTAAEIGCFGHHRTILIKLLENKWVVFPEEWMVTTFNLKHDAAEPIGFFISHGDDRLLFIPDTCLVENRFNGITVLAVEVNYQEEILHENIVGGAIPAIVGRRTRRNHMSLNTVKDLILANDLSRCREIWLLHLSDGNSNEAQMRKEIQEITGIPTYAAQE